MPSANKRKKSRPAFYETPANSIGYLSRVTFRSFSRALERLTLPYGVSSGQWRFLRVLWTEDGLTQRELSERVGLREPTTVTALKSMVKAGLVRRVKNDHDRRKIYVFLTAKGRRLKDKLFPFVVEVNERALRGLSEAEVTALRKTLLHINKNLAELPDAAVKPGA